MMFLVFSTWEGNNKREWKPLIDSYTKWGHELLLGYISPLTSAIIVSPNIRDFAGRDCDLFQTPFLIYFLIHGAQTKINYFLSRIPPCWKGKHGLETQDALGKHRSSVTAVDRDTSTERVAENSPELRHQINIKYNYVPYSNTFTQGLHCILSLT